MPIWAPFSGGGDRAPFHRETADFFRIMIKKMYFRPFILQVKSFACSREQSEELVFTFRNFVFFLFNKGFGHYKEKAIFWQFPFFRWPLVRIFLTFHPFSRSWKTKQGDCCLQTEIREKLCESSTQIVSLPKRCVIFANSSFEQSLNKKWSWMHGSYLSCAQQLIGVFRF